MMTMDVYLKIIIIFFSLAFYFWSPPPFLLFTKRDPQKYIFSLFSYNFFFFKFISGVACSQLLWTAETGAALSQILYECHKLQTLSIAGSGPIDWRCRYNLNAIIQALHDNPSITELNLEGNQLRNSGIKLLARSLRQNSNLKMLYWDHNDMGLEGKICYNPLPQKKSLIEFNWWNLIKINGIGLRSMREALRFNNSIVTMGTVSLSFFFILFNIFK